MKNQFYLLVFSLTVMMLCNPIVLHSQVPVAITIEPENAGAWDVVTLTLDARLSCPEGALFDADSVMIHSGVTIDGAIWQNIIEYNNYGINGQQPKLTNNGDSTWSITFIPADFYGIEPGALVEEICCVFNAGSWYAGEGKDWDEYGNCVDFFIPLSAPLPAEIFFIMDMKKAYHDGIFNPSSDQVFIEIEGFEPVALYESWAYVYEIYLTPGLLPGENVVFEFSVNQEVFENVSREIKIISGWQSYQTWWNDDPWINLSGALSIVPEEFDTWDEITLTLNANLSCPYDALLGLDYILMHSGVTINDNYWRNVITYDNLGVNGQEPKLVNNGDNTYSITLIPGEFFGILYGEEPEAINCVFNGGNWSLEGKDFSPDFYCIDFYIPFDSITTSIDIPENQRNVINIYPNPAYEVLNIKNLPDKAGVEVFNIIGTKLMTVNEIENGSVSLNTQNFQPGIYFIRVSDKNQNLEFKFVKY